MAIDDADVIRTWNESSSPGEAACKLGVPRLPFLERALILRIQGHDLKRMDLLEPHQRAQVGFPWRRPNLTQAPPRVRQPVRGQRRNTRNRYR